uniref:hypothetical protein n=1 Tax=uncultured Paenibacillus sp. TaxID=227322 RepID=UPI0025F19F46
LLYLLLLLQYDEKNELAITSKKKGTTKIHPIRINPFQEMPAPDVNPVTRRSVHYPDCRRNWLCTKP